MNRPLSNRRGRGRLGYEASSRAARAGGTLHVQAVESAVSFSMRENKQDEGCPEKSYWKVTCDWVKATQERYKGFARGDLTQCFMRGPFAGWSERQVAELADLLSKNAERFPLRGHDELDWGASPIAEAKDDQVEGATKANGEEGGEGGGDYCPVCRSCGEEGCCTTEGSILSHGCQYAQYYAQQVCCDKMVIDEFHKLVEGMGLVRDETGGEPKDPIGDLYDRAWKRVEEKYGKA